MWKRSSFSLDLLHQWTVFLVYGLNGWLHQYLPCTQGSVSVCDILSVFCGFKKQDGCTAKLKVSKQNFTIKWMMSWWVNTWSNPNHVGDSRCEHKSHSYKWHDLLEIYDFFLGANRSNCEYSKCGTLIPFFLLKWLCLRKNHMNYESHGGHYTNTALQSGAVLGV